MPRKKKTDADTEGPTEMPPLALPLETQPTDVLLETSRGEPQGAADPIPPPDANGHPPATPTPTSPQPSTNGNGHRKPLISWRLQSDRTTSVEVACWPNTFRTQAGEEYEQLTFTVSRSYRDQAGMWVKGGSWRTHDLPILTFLIAKAHDYALLRRTTVNADCPF